MGEEKAGTGVRASAGGVLSPGTSARCLACALRLFALCCTCQLKTRRHHRNWFKFFLSVGAAAGSGAERGRWSGLLRAQGLGLGDVTLPELWCSNECAAAQRVYEWGVKEAVRLGSRARGGGGAGALYSRHELLHCPAASHQQPPATLQRALTGEAVVCGQDIGLSLVWVGHLQVQGAGPGCIGTDQFARCGRAWERSHMPAVTDWMRI